MTTDAWSAVVFYIAAILAILGGLRMVTDGDMVRSALSLVLALGSVAVIYLLLSADFLAMVQILVYLGAIMILMLFAIMLTPGQVELPAMAEQGQRLWAAATAIVVGAITLFAVVPYKWAIRPAPLNVATIDQIGQRLFSTYVLPFEIASLLLTAAMIGAIVIARED